MRKQIIIGLTAAVAAVGGVRADAVPEWQAKARRDFADQRFGIFVHWGFYSMYAQGEWYQLSSKAKREDYAQAMHGFCPAAFDAKKWVAAFKDAGAKYVTFTSRHHDGFSMFASRFSGGYDILHTPFKRDICKELADACHAAGVQINFYYSLMDWWRTDYPIGEYSANLGDKAANANANYGTYKRFMLDQLGELLSEKYAPVGCIWMDGEGDHFDDRANALPNGWDFDSIYDFIHARGALVGNNNNHPTREKEDIQFFEMTKSAGIAGAKATGNGKPFERCSTMQKHVWGYKLTGEFYTPEEMIALLVRNAAKGVNLLLNVGPRADGDLPPEAYAILKAMGAWMRRNGESVYATDAGEVSAGDGIVSTSGRDGTLYLHFVDPVLKSFAFKPPRRIASAVCLATGKAEKVETTPSGDAVITIAREAGDGFDHVVRVTLEEP